MNRKEKLLKIRATYGINAQLKKFNEETFEVIEAIIGYEACGRADVIKSSSKKHIAEEISDCYVMLEQFRLFYHIDKEDIEKIMDYKIDRQIKRIELGGQAYEHRRYNKRHRQSNKLSK